MSAKRLLLVDDSPVFREAARLLLRDVPEVAVCGLAESGTDALEQVRGDPPDLVLLDVSMRGLDGYETLERLRAQGYAAPILLMSFAGSSPSRERNARSDGFVDKSDLLNGLRNCIVRLFPDVARSTGALRP